MNITHTLQNETDWAIIPNVSQNKLSLPTKGISGLVATLTEAIIKQTQESNDHTTLLSFWLSPFALMCLMTALIMNRVIIFASSRRRQRLPTISRIILRLIALLVLFEGSYGLFIAMKTYCDYPSIQLLLKSSYFDFDLEKFKVFKFFGLPYTTRLLQRQTCIDGHQIIKYGPTSSFLKPFHLALCLSQILETFISVTSGLRPRMETGITLFEYSLAFTEAYPAKKPNNQLLIVALIALCHQVNVHIIGLFNLQDYRLIPSTVLGVSTLGYYSYNLFSGGLLNFPFVITMSYFPHFCVVFIILISHLIYSMAAIARMSFEDLTMQGMMGNLKSTNITLRDDFYTALIAYGSFIVNVTAKNSFVHETSHVYLPSDNYISREVKRVLKEINQIEVDNINGYANEFTSDLEIEQDLETERPKLTAAIKSRFSMLNWLIKRFAVLMIFNFTRLRSHQEPIDALGDVIRRSDGIYFQPKKTLCLDDIDDDQLENDYAKFLLETELSDHDESPDFCLPQFELDDSDDEFIRNGNGNGNGNDNDNNTNSNEYSNELKTFGELIHPNDFTSILLAQSHDRITENRIMNYHLENIDQHSSKLTRSNFSKYYVDDLKLLDILKEKFTSKSLKGSFNTYPATGHINQYEDLLGTCVICHTNSRQVILWPCKCIAICDACRLSLSLRKFSTCCCCRKKVEGFSKVYVP